MKLNIGCGYEKKKGFINIDKTKEVNPDIILNIEKGLPFKNDEVDYIYSEHCLEHIRPQYWKFVLNEIHRVCRDGAIIELKLPFDNIGQRTNADHYRTFTWGSFNQFDPDSKRFYYSKLKLKKLNKIPNRLIRTFFYLFPFLKYEVYYKFKVIKTKRFTIQTKCTTRIQTTK